MLIEDHTREGARGSYRAHSSSTGGHDDRTAHSFDGFFRDGSIMAGYPAEMLAQCLKRAFDEVLEQHPEFEDDVRQFAMLMGEVLCLSPEFAWAKGNIWHDVDPEVKN